MTPRRRIPVAVATLALLLATGCSSDSDSPDTGAAGSESPSTPSASASTPAPSSAPAAAAAETLSPLTGAQTRLTLDQAFLDTLGAVGIDLTAVQGAQTDDAGGDVTFVFPVTGGEATVDAAGTDRFAGTVEHQGGLQLSALGRSVVVDGLVLDGAQDQLTASIAGRRVPLLPLSTEDATITQQDGEVVIEDDAVSLDAQAADALTGGLGLPSLPQLALGSLQVTLTGP